MITDSRITDYINSLDPGDGELCDGIAREAVRSGVPIVRRETAALIKTMLALKKPERILEVGTAVGYSALLMARSMPETAHITTIEKYEKRIPIARENFKRAGMEEKITLLEGDAGRDPGSLPVLCFIFMDAGQGPVCPLAAGRLKTSGPRRTFNVRQCAPGWDHCGVQVRGGAPGPDHPCPDAGIPLYFKII